MKNHEVMLKELASDSLNDSVGSTRNRNVRMTNKIRGCECAPKYYVAQTWHDGRIRLCERCGISPCIMLDPNGTYRVQVDEDLSGWPEDVREKMRQGIKDIKKKNERAGCELQWNGKTYTFHGYY
jgi:hypothetical protein